VDFSVIADNLELYLEGLATTVSLVAAALVIGLCLAVPLGIVQSSRNPLLRLPVFCFSYFFRGTPLLVQAFLIYYGAGQFAAVQGSLLWPILREAYWCALIAFSLNTAAYTTEILRGAIVAAPYGEIEAAWACGMSRAVTMRRIILPGAFRRALPAYGNEVIFMLHGSAIASVITLIDLTGAARIINARYYTPYEAFLTAAAFYMALTFLIVGGFRLLERKWYAHLRARDQR